MERTRRRIKQYIFVRAHRYWMDVVSRFPCQRFMGRDELASRCRYVRLRSRGVCLDHFPDFLLLGPQRTGTTWLYSNLIMHPEIFMPAVKEIHYFNLLCSPEHRAYKSRDLGWYVRQFYASPYSAYYKDRWIREKYRVSYNPRMRGEASASYAVMNRDVIEDILVLNPDIKVVLLVRNPIERAWSNAKRVLGTKTRRKIKDVPEDEILNFLRDAHQIESGSFSRIISTWRDAVKEGNVFVRKFDEIGESPHRVMLDLFGFLGVDSSAEYITERSTTIINKTERQGRPPGISRELDGIFARELDVLKGVGFEW